MFVIVNSNVVNAAAFATADPVAEPDKQTSVDPETIFPLTPPSEIAVISNPPDTVPTLTASPC